MPARALPTSAFTLPPWPLACAVALAIVGGARPADAVKVRVRGGASLSARAIPRTDGLEVRGTLTDDAGRPVGRAHVRGVLRAVRGGPPRSLPVPRACAPTAAARLHFASDELVVDTDGSGAFCFVLPAPGIEGMLELRFEGDPHYDRGSVSLDVDARRASVSLRFTPEPRQLSLDRPEHVVFIESRVDPPLPAGVRESVDLVLTSKGAAAPLAKTTVGAGERTELRFESASLGRPGTGELAVRFGGSEALQPAAAKAPVTRTARVNLSLAGPVTRDGDAAIVDLAVGSVAGAVPDGAVEAVLADTSLGTAPVVDGAARWTGTLHGARSGATAVTFRYLPAAPWWLPGEPLGVAVPVAPPSPWRNVGWIIAAAFVAGWVVRGWRRPARSERKLDRDAGAPPSGRPSVALLERGAARSGWRGRVLDAHDGTPIANAEVAVLRPSFEGDGVAARCHSDDEGRFELEHVEGAEGAVMRIEARLHSALERPLPPAGSVAIHLISRRRKLLERLVRWAERAGAPWSNRSDPTPGQVAGEAQRRGAEHVKRWADAVEAAAYGPEAPDATVEQSVRAAEPPPAPAENADRPAAPRQR